MKKRTTLMSTCTCLLVAGTVGGAVIASGATSDTKTVNDVLLPQTSQPIPELQPAQSSNFELLRGQATAGDAISQAARAQIGGPSVFGKNLSLARAIDTPDGTGWVVPGDDAICLAVPDGGTGTYGVACNSTDEAVAGLAISTLTRPNNPTVRVIGLLPDNASAPVVTFADGSRQAIATRRGVISAVLREPRTLAVTTALGSTQVDISPVRERTVTIACGDGRQVTVQSAGELAGACSA